MKDLKKKTIHGVKWLVAARIAQKTVSFSTFVVLAKILEPSVFGVFALAFVVIDGLGMFQSLGIDTALIQRKDDIEKAANTAFFVFPMVGMLLFMFLYFFAPFAANMLSEVSLIPVIRVLGLLFIIKCFSRVPATLYVKELNFKIRTLIEITADLTNSLLAVLIAFYTRNVWALVFGYIGKQLILLIGFWLFSSWRPKMEFDWGIAKELFHFGKFVFAGSVLWFLISNLDKTLIGRMLGTAQLGCYTLAFNFAMLVSTHMSNLVSQVMFPAYSKIQDDRNKLREVFLKTVTYTSLIVVPFCAGLIVMGPDFIKIVYDDKWLDSVVPLQILAVAGVMTAVCSLVNPVILAAGKSVLNFKLNCLWLILLVPALFAGINIWGINGAAMGYTLTLIIVTFIGLIWVMPIIKLSFSEMMQATVPSIKASIVMLIIILISRHTANMFFDGYNTGLAGFAFTCVVAVFSYVFSVDIKFKQALLKNIGNYRR